MALPTSRNTTYAVGTQIKSVDLNDIQDMIIGGKHGVKRLWLSAALTLSDLTETPYYLEGAGEGEIGVPLHEGDRITDIDVVVKDTVAAKIQCKMVDLNTSTGTADETRTFQDSDQSGNVQEVALSEDLPYTIATNEAIVIISNHAAATHRLYGAWVTYDRP